MVERIKKIECKKTLLKLLETGSIDILELTEKQMEVVKKYFLTDKTIKQVGVELGLSAGTIDDRVRAVYEKVRRKLY